MSKVQQERGFGSLPSSTEANLRDHVKSISTTVEADTNSIGCMGSSQYVVSTSQNSKLIYETRQTTIPFLSRLNDYYYKEKKGSYGPKFLEANSYEASHINNSIPRKEKNSRSFTLPYYINNVCFDNVGGYWLPKFLEANSYEASHINNSIPRKEKNSRSFTLPYYINNVCFDNALADLGASIDVFKRKITLRVGNEKIIFKSMKPASSLIKRVYMLALRERMELDLEARLIRHTLWLNRSLDPLYGDYIELNDLNVPLKLRRDQVDDLMPTIEEGKETNIQEKDEKSSQNGQKQARNGKA
ncbi:hypothetical protein Tco_0643722 [Tanacetum coccineum]